jgi:hypothetical protein
MAFPLLRALPHARPCCRPESSGRAARSWRGKFEWQFKRCDESKVNIAAQAIRESAEIPLQNACFYELVMVR